MKNEDIELTGLAKMKAQKTFSEFRKWIADEYILDPVTKAFILETGYEGSEFSGLFEIWQNIQYDVTNNVQIDEEEYNDQIEHALPALDKAVKVEVKMFEKMFK